MTPCHWVTSYQQFRGTVPSSSRV